MSPRALPALALALALAGAAAPARAQSSTRRFQQYVSQAQRAYQRGDADAAVRALERAYALRAVPQLLFNIARAHETAGRLELAVEYYGRFLASDPPAAEADQARALRRVAQATIDERNRPPAPPPRAGGAGVVGRVGTAAGPNGRNPHPRPAGRAFGAGHGTLIVGGTVLAAAGAVLGVLAMNTAAEFRATDDGAQRAGLADRGTGLAWGANAGIGAGIISVGLGVILYFLQPVPPAGAPATMTGGRAE